MRPSGSCGVAACHSVLAASHVQEWRRSEIIIEGGTHIEHAFEGRCNSLAVVSLSLGFYLIFMLEEIEYIIHLVNVGLRTILAEKTINLLYMSV